MYPIAASSSATLVIITDVEFVISAVEIVLSILLPSASFSSIPNSSINAPLVPDPSSREITVISSLAALPHPVIAPISMADAKTPMIAFFNFLIFFVSFFS